MSKSNYKKLESSRSAKTAVEIAFERAKAAPRHGVSSATHQVENFLVASIRQQRDWMLRSPGIYFDLPRENIRFDHVLGCIASAKGRDKDRPMDDEVWNQRIFKILTHAPHSLHTELLMTQALLGTDTLHTYSATRALPDTAKARELLDGHPLATESFAIDLVRMNPWVMTMLPPSLLTPQVLATASARACQPEMNIDLEQFYSVFDAIDGADSFGNRVEDGAFDFEADEVIDDIDVDIIERALGIGLVEHIEPDNATIEAALGVVANDEVFDDEEEFVDRQERMRG